MRACNRVGRVVSFIGGLLLLILFCWIANSIRKAIENIDHQAALLRENRKYNRKDDTA
jgi:hypothetical protein